MINFQGRNTITVGELIEMLSRLDAALPVLNGGYGMDCLTIKTETLQKAKESPLCCPIARSIGNKRKSGWHSKTKNHDRLSPPCFVGVSSVANSKCS